MKTIKTSNDIVYKDYITQVVDDRIKSLSKDIATYEKMCADDFIHYMTVRLKSHTIAYIQRQWLVQLRELVEKEDTEKQIREWLQSDVSFMMGKLMNFKVVQTTNELVNLKENYQLEAYSELIRLYNFWLNHK